MEIMESPSGDGSLENIGHSDSECQAFVYNGDSDSESQGSGSAGKVRCHLGDLGTGG